MRRTGAAIQKQNLDAGVIANAFGPDRNVPRGVCTGIILTPPPKTSSRPELSKQSARLVVMG
jgi:hypothetical protein